MKLKYKTKKPNRIKSYGFMGIDCDDVSLWWYYNVNKWDINHTGYGYFSSNCPCNSIKAFRRRLKEWSKYVPSGTEFRLCSRWVGYDVIGKIK
jgi:hypothetical protein